MRGGHAECNLVVDVNRSVLISFVRTAVERAERVRRKAEREITLGGGLPKPFQVARSLRRSDEYRFGGGEGVGVLFGSAPVLYTSYVEDGNVRAGTVCEWARFSVTVHPGPKVRRGNEGGGGGRVGGSKVGIAFEEMAMVREGLQVAVARVLAVCGESRGERPRGPRCRK